MIRKHLKTTSIVIAGIILFSACKKNDPPTPDEQELITTLKLNVTGSGGFSKTFVYKIENGFGSTTQGTVQIDTVQLAANTSYHVAATLLNEKADAGEQDVTEEVLTEQDEHLFLYNSTPASGAGSVSTSGGSMDHNGLPFNQTIDFTTGAAGTGTLQVNLMHQPTNKMGTTPATSGGETDVEAIFPVILQ